MQGTGSAPSVPLVVALGSRLALAPLWPIAHLASVRLPECCARTFHGALLGSMLASLGLSHCKGKGEPTWQELRLALNVTAEPTGHA